MVVKLPLKLPGDQPIKWWECSISVNDNVGGNCFIYVVESQGPKLELMAKVNHCDLNFSWKCDDDQLSFQKLEQEWC